MDFHHNNFFVDESKFFSVPANADPIIGRVISELKIQRDRNPNLIESIVKRNGYPIWDKAQITKQDNAYQSLVSGEDTIIYIPLAVHGEEKVTAFFLATVNNYIELQLYNKFDYEEFGFDTTGMSNANRLALQFMILDFVTFGHKSFVIHDNRLLKDFQIALDAPIKDRTVHIDYYNDSVYGRGWEIREFYVCTSSKYLQCSTPGVCCSDGSCSLCHNSDCWRPKVSCEKVTSLIYYDAGDPPSGGNSGGGGGGGGGGSLPGSSTNVELCNPTPLIQNGLPPCPKGTSLGWEPILPYVSTYQLNQHEQDVFNQLDAEDDLENLNHQNSDCKGTKRTGNIYFNGTIQHWMIQLHYVSQNPIYGDAEFAIPNSSPSGNRGYADIVNLESKSIFEIKPDNPNGWSSGMSEVANYVSKANQYCSSIGSFGVPWSQGGSYDPVTIPTGIPNRYLKTRLYAPGVIVYSYEDNLNPYPAPPSVVPTSMVDKFKHLIDRLQGNFDQADQIIAEYFRQNPDLVNYIKAAAIGAGIAIVVGTIIEDVLTAGFGIADDWACFVLSYRIIRFAIAL